VSIKSNYDDKAKVFNIVINGRFNIELQKAFKQAYVDINDKNITFRVNLEFVDYMDSSALGMLNLLRQHADNAGGKTVLVKPKDLVLRILKLAHFDTLFQIEL